MATVCGIFGNSAYIQNDRLRRRSQWVDATLYHNEVIKMECSDEVSNPNLLFRSAKK